MKYIFLMLLCLFATVETFAQTTTKSSGLIVLEKKWQAKPFKSVSSALNEDPFRANNETNQALQDRKDNLRDNEIRRKRNLPLEPVRVRFRTVTPEYPSPNLTSYVYQIKVRNGGAKTIQTVVWEYVFLNRADNQEAGRQQFTSKTNLKPGATDKLIIRFGSAPSSVVSAADAGKRPRDQYVEQVNIKSIRYSDGSIWQADSN